MAVLDPTGGLRDISTLNESSPSLFHEDFSESDSEEHTSEPLVTSKPRRKSRFTATARALLKNKKQVNDRFRLVLRITSTVASGATLGALGSVLYSYKTTNHYTQDDGRPVWPTDIHFEATYVMLAAAAVTFVVDLGFFVASIKISVRMLEGAVVKVVALALATTCVSLVLAAVVTGEAVRDGALMWTCKVKKPLLGDADAVIIDFPFLCGEMVASKFALSVVLVLQIMILLSILFAIFYRGGPKKPKVVVEKGYKPIKGWRSVMDRVGL